MDCPNCGVSEFFVACDYCHYPQTEDQSEITRFLARQSITKVAITDCKRISKIAGTTLSILAGAKILLILFMILSMMMIGIPAYFLFLLFLMPVLYLVLGILAIRFPIPGISVAILVYIVDNYMGYTSGAYSGSFLGIVFSLAFLSVLIVGLVNGIKYEILKKNNPYLYALINNETNVINDDLLD